MPIYEFYCDRCSASEDVFRPVSSINSDIKHSCGRTMRRLFSVPRILVKQTANDMALSSLNNKDTSYMKPEHKLAAARGLSRVRPLEEKVFTGF